MKIGKRVLALLLTLVLALPVCGVSASAKGSAAGQTVDTVLFYVTNSAGEDILVAQIPVAEMEADMAAGKIDSTLHNYSLLDNLTTTVHQEAEGFTVPEFVTYAQEKSTLDSVKNLNLTYMGGDRIAFWEIDQTGFDDQDTYSYDELYGTARYNFPLLYEYWNYRTQDYYDPAGQMNRDQVIEHIFTHGEPEFFLLSVRAFSQRYAITEGKQDAGDYNMEGLWNQRDLLDNERAIRLLKPMSEADLRNRVPTVADTRYWVSRIRLDMEKDPNLTSLGEVSAPTAVMTEDADNYYIRFDCATPGATILYNHNYLYPSYMPTAAYAGSPVIVPKGILRDSALTMTCQAVKEGYTDAGVITLTLTSSGTEEQAPWNNPFHDVEEGAWYYDAVAYVVRKGIFNGTDTNAFSPDATMTRAMFATALWRAEGEPAAGGENLFPDVVNGEWYTDAVLWASSQKLVNGYETGYFGVNDPITREQMATLLYRYAQTKGVDAAAVGDAAFRAFPDASETSGYAREAMAWAAGAGVVEAVPGSSNLAPTANAARAQVARALFVLRERVL